MHSNLTDEIHEHADRLLTRVDRLKRFLVLTRDLSLEDATTWHFATMESRGSAIVGVCAELEALTRFTLQRTHTELNQSAILLSDLIPCLRQLAIHSTFESLRDLQDHSKLWARREYATTLDQQPDRVQLPIVTKQPQPPLDGKTLKPEHFYRIWSIYGLQGDAFPSVAWAASLQKMALLRNDIAHGNLPFVEVFQQAGTSMSEIERYVDDISCFAIHFVDEWCRYIGDVGYCV